MDGQSEGVGGRAAYPEEVGLLERELAAADRPDPEIRRMVDWLAAEADRLQALASQLEDALALILPVEVDARVVVDDGVARAPRSPLGQRIAGAAARFEQTNHRLYDLVERVRATL